MWIIYHRTNTEGVSDYTIYVSMLYYLCSDIQKIIDCILFSVLTHLKIFYWKAKWKCCSSGGLSFDYCPRTPYYLGSVRIRTFSVSGPLLCKVRYIWGVGLLKKKRKKTRLIVGLHQHLSVSIVFSCCKRRRKKKKEECGIRYHRLSQIC